jgi:hypothetical protein
LVFIILKTGLGQKPLTNQTPARNEKYKLMFFVVPDEDLGLPENVEDIVTAMIKHNS